MNVDMLLTCSEIKATTTIYTMHENNVSEASASQTRSNVVLSYSGLSEVLRDKERRAQQQLERCAEQRGRKMEEQRRKEQQRRTAAEEKRRQQQEAEKVRGRSTLTAWRQRCIPKFKSLFLVE